MSGKKLSVTVFRYDPKNREEPHYETYSVPQRPGMFVLDALIYIYENLDSSLAFQYSCRSRRCGSCAVLVDGIPCLACMKKIEKDFKVQPLQGFPVIKDLVVDLSKAEQRILPFKHSKMTSQEIELLPADSVQKYIELTKCIGCYVCLSECPIPTKRNSFAGPEALLQVARRTYDPRDGADRAKEANSWGLYECTTCYACEVTCPKKLSPVNGIIDLRSLVVEKGQITPIIRDVLESLFKNGNPWGRIRSKRSEWSQGLNVENFSQDTDILYFVGCTPAYDPRLQKVARSLVRCFEKAQINFGTFGNSEICCGNEVYDIGEKGLFKLLVAENMNKFAKHNVKELVTISPHCYNAFKNRYGKTSFKAQHYTQYIVKLIDEGNLSFSKKVSMNVTYQDPCSLGKLNGVYDEPRQILKSIPGVNFIELERSRERSLCCGGGGGRMWNDSPGESLSERQVREAVKVGAEIFATACPFCLSMLEDAVKTAGFEESIKVMDIAELLSAAI